METLHSGRSKKRALLPSTDESASSPQKRSTPQSHKKRSRSPSSPLLQPHTQTTPNIPPYALAHNIHSTNSMHHGHQNHHIHHPHNGHGSSIGSPSMYNQTSPHAPIHSPTQEAHSPLSPLEPEIVLKGSSHSLLKMATTRALTEAKGYVSFHKVKQTSNSPKADPPQKTWHPPKSEERSPLSVNVVPSTVDVDHRRHILDVLELDGVRSSPHTKKGKPGRRFGRSKSTGDMYDMLLQARLHTDQLVHLKSECDEQIRKTIEYLRSPEAQLMASSQPLYRGYIAQICDIGSQILLQSATNADGYLLRERIQRILGMQTRWQPDWPGQNSVTKILYYMAELARHAVSTASEFNPTLPKQVIRQTSSSPIVENYPPRCSSPISLSSDFGHSPQNPGTPIEYDVESGEPRAFPLKHASESSQPQGPQFDQNYFTNYIYDKLSRWNSSNQESPKDEKINDDRRDTSTPDPGNHILDGEGNQEDKGDIVCRICEEDVPRHKLRMHSRFCVVYQKTMMKMSGIDAKLQKQVLFVNKQLSKVGCRVANEQGLSIADGLEQLKGIIQNTIPPFGPENPHAIPMCHRYMSELRLIKETFKSVPVVFEACENYERVLNSKREMIKELQETAKLRDSVNYPLGTPYTSTGGDQSPIPSPGTMTPRTGKNALSATCKDFVFIKTISRGAFGRVFLAQKKRTGDYYAIKVLKKEEMSWKNQIERVKAEQRILAGTENPFVVKLYYSFESRDKFFLVMEYIQGGDCYSLLRNLLYLEESQAKMYMAEVVLALEYLHGRGIVHRDLKPDNMLINRDGHIKLTDFGLSRFNLLEDMKSKHPRQLSRDAAPSTTGGVGDTNAGVSVLLGRRRSARISGSYLPDLAAQRGAPVGVGDARLSGVGNVSRNSCVGTPDYLAPEIIRGMEYGPAVDWWALGVVLYELLVGLPPFHAETREIIFQNILEYNSLEIEWPEDDVYVISQDAKDLVAKLLTVDQKKRLGANGAQDVKQHPFFRDVDWDTLLQQKAAFIPQPSDCQDTSYFVDEKGSVTISLDDRADTEDATPSKPPSGEEDRKDESVRQDIDPKGEKTGSKFETDDFNFVNLEFLDHMNNELAQEATLNRKRTGTGSPVVHFHTSGSACPSPAEGKNTYASPRAASLD